jgi:hypothetical protein
LDMFYIPTLICTSPDLCPWPVWRAHWSSWCRLLGGAPCLVVLQTLGLSERVYIYWVQIGICVMYMNALWRKKWCSILNALYLLVSLLSAKVVEL